MKNKIYLSGASKYVVNCGNEWREKAKRLLSNNENVVVFSPNDYYNYTDLSPKTPKECKKYLLKNLNDRDIVLLNLDYTNSSVGTGFEIALAEEKNIPIIGFGNTDVYDWIKEGCWVIFDTLEESVDYINNYF